MTVQSIVVLGGGSAGFMAAITLKRKLPHLKLQAIRSPDIGVIGVGEGTTLAFPKHFFEYLKLKPQLFYEQAEPTRKLGLKFLWGPRKESFCTFSCEFQHRYPERSRNNGFFFNGDCPWAGRVSTFMAHDHAFPRQSDAPRFQNHHAFHVENKKLVGWLERVARDFGVAVRDATVSAERGPEGIAALVTETGERIPADLFLDASGFRSELLDRAAARPGRTKPAAASM
jgi:tryptophan halogenase